MMAGRPILSIKEENFQLGGVGNVARNISNLGGRANIVSLIGNDISSKYIEKLIKKTKLLPNKLEHF